MMGQKQTTAARIAELEKQLASAQKDNAAWEECYNESQADYRTARAEVNRYKTEEDRQRRIAEHKKRDEERAAERDRLHALGEGVVDLSKIKHDLGFDYDHDTKGGTVTITLHANATEAKILNAYATRDRKASIPPEQSASTLTDAINRIYRESVFRGHIY